MKVKKVQINLHNKTTYLAKDLKKLCSFVLKRYLKTNYDFDHKQLHVYCEPHGGKNVSPSAIVWTPRSPISTRPPVGSPCRSRLWKWLKTRPRSSSSVRPTPARRLATSWAPPCAKRPPRSNPSGLLVK